MKSSHTPSATTPSSSTVTRTNPPATTNTLPTPLTALAAVFGLNKLKKTSTAPLDTELGLEHMKITDWSQYKQK